MQFIRFQKLFSVFTLLSVSFVTVSHAFMKLETKQIFSPQENTIQNITTMDMSGMFDQFETMGISISDLPPEEQAKLEASFDGICDQAKAQLGQIDTLSPETMIDFNSEDQAGIEVMMQSFTCKKISFGRFEIGMNLPLEDENYVIEDGKFIVEGGEETFTPEIKQQIDLLINQEMQSDTITADQIKQMKALGVEVKMLMVFPGKVLESNIGDISGNMVRIDLWQEVLKMMERRSMTDFFEQFMQMRIVSEIDDYAVNTVEAEEQKIFGLNERLSSVIIPTKSDIFENELLDTTTESVIENFSDETLLELLETELKNTDTMSQEDLFFEMFMSDEPMIENMNNEEIMALLEAENVSIGPLSTVIAKPVVHKETKPDTTTSLITVQPIRSAPKTVAPVMIQLIDTDSIEKTVINNIFEPTVFEDSAVEKQPTKKVSYSPDRIFNNIKSANAARQFKRGNSTSRYVDFFRRAVK